MCHAVPISVDRMVHARWRLPACQCRGEGRAHKPFPRRGRDSIPRYFSPPARRCANAAPTGRDFSSPTLPEFFPPFPRRDNRLAYRKFPLSVKQALLPGTGSRRGLQAEVFVSRERGAAPARRAAQKADLHQVRLVNVLDGDGFFADGGRERFQPDRAAVVKFDQRGQQAPVVRVEAERVDFQLVKAELRRVAGDAAVRNDLREIAHALEQPVRDTRRPAGTRGNLQRAVRLDGDAENFGAARHDLRQLLRRIQAPAGARRRSGHAAAR